MGRVKRKRRVGRGRKINRCLRVRLLLGGIEVRIFGLVCRTTADGQLLEMSAKSVSRPSGVPERRLGRRWRLSYEKDLMTTLYSMMTSIVYGMRIAHAPLSIAHARVSSMTPLNSTQSTIFTCSRTPMIGTKNEDAMCRILEHMSSLRYYMRQQRH